MTPPRKAMSAAGAHRRVEVGNGSRTREARDRRRPAWPSVLLRLDHPFEAAGMRFGGIAAHDQHQVGILDVDPMVGHRATPKCRTQTGYRGGVSDAGLRIEGDGAQAQRLGPCG